MCFYSTTLTVKQLIELCQALAEGGWRQCNAYSAVDRMSQEARGGDARSVFIYFGGHVIPE